MSRTVQVVMQQVTQTSTEWAETDTLIRAGVICVETDDAADAVVGIKIGVGDKTFAQLDYVGDPTLGTAADVDVDQLAPAASATNRSDKAVKNTGSTVIDSQTWQPVDTDLDLVIEAAVGQQIVAGADLLWGNAALYGALDFGTVDGDGELVNRLAAGDNGIMGLLGSPSEFTPANAESPPYTVQADDVVGGVVRLRLFGRTLVAGTKSMQSATGNPITVWARALG